MIARTTGCAGAFLVGIGLLGFIAPDFMGMHLSAPSNIVYLVSGVIALYFAVKASATAARILCIVFGVIYGLLGLAGFVAGGQDYVLTVIPEILVLAALDHLLHLALGLIFLSAGGSWQPTAATPRPRY